MRSGVRKFIAPLLKSIVTLSTPPAVTRATYLGLKINNAMTHDLPLILFPSPYRNTASPRGLVVDHSVIFILGSEPMERRYVRSFFLQRRKIRSQSLRGRRTARRFLEMTTAYDTVVVFTPCQRTIRVT
jgi:hypothetical protein